MAFHETAQEHFDKLSRVYERLENEIHKDDLDDFFKTAYHLLENIKKDPKATTAQKAAAKTLYNEPEMELCRELTNKSKNYTLDKFHHPHPKIKDATTQQGFGVGRFGRGGFGTGEQLVTLNLNDGRKLDAYDLMAAIYAKYKAIF